jgi:hypothetical protein
MKIPAIILALLSRIFLGILDCGSPANYGNTAGARSKGEDFSTGERANKMQIDNWKRRILTGMLLVTINIAIAAFSEEKLLQSQEESAGKCNKSDKIKPIGRKGEGRRSIKRIKKLIANKEIIIGITEDRSSGYAENQNKLLRVLTAKIKMSDGAMVPAFIVILRTGCCVRMRYQDKGYS